MGARGAPVAAMVAAAFVAAGCSAANDLDASPSARPGRVAVAEVVVRATPLPGDHERALLALAGGTPHARLDPLPVDGHSHGAPHTGASPPAEAATALHAARRAARRLLGVRRLETSGYHLGSYWSAGVGTHFIDWRLVGRPFDPATPAMLLVDTTPGHRRRLAGFSYWVHGGADPPVGFPGAADQWHRHRGLCFVDGVLAREGVADGGQCEGVWIDAAGLWMLHAWVVPGFENPDGVFAPTNPRLCPPRSGVDAAWCA